MELSVTSWNMAHRIESWDWLLQMRPDIALLQEAVPPPNAVKQRPGATFYPPTDSPNEWKTHAGYTRDFAAGVACFNAKLSCIPKRPAPLAQATSTTLVSSHPGSFAVADLYLPDGAMITVVSLYGVWYRQPGIGSYPEATLHRAISDLAPVFQAPPSGGIIVAGDFNMYRGHSDRWRARYDTVFARLAAYGLELIGPQPPSGRGPLPRCLCGPKPNCRHVQTYRHLSRPGSRPFQLDFMFATKRLKDRLVSCHAFDTPEVWERSNHCPVIATFDL